MDMNSAKASRFGVIALKLLKAYVILMSTILFFRFIYYTVGSDLFFLVFAAIAYALMHIFQYGAKLQTLEDETL